MTVIIDTNVLYQALRSKLGASHYILQLIRERKINIAISIKVFNEYEDVLKRPEKLKELNLDSTDIDKILALLAFIGKPCSTHFLFRPNLKDENDNMFLELALASSSNCIITNNIKDFTQNNELKFETIEIMTPTDFLRKWRKKNEE